MHETSTKDDSILERVLVTAEAEVRPTEDPQKVARALSNIFSGNQTEKPPGKEWATISLEGQDLSALEKFKQIIQRDRIRAAARSVMSRSIVTNRIEVYLNKQAAFAGHISFSQPEGESPLGPIRLIIECQDPMAIIDWLTGGFIERKTA